jgi:DNA-binding NarL/FixJ family response regulator
VFTDHSRPLRRALLVEDSTPLRALMSAALESAGFGVVACASASEAIKVFGKHDPDVLIADIDLGDRPNGVELATILRAQAPYLGIVFVTNYPSTKAFERTIAPPIGYAFLQKDLLDSTDRLIEVVESALNDAATPRVVISDGADQILNRLTPTQLEMLRLMAAGLTNTEISERRNSSLRAVERLITRTFEVLELNDDPARNPRVSATNLYTRAFGYPILEKS